MNVDGQRLWARLEALGEIGAVHGPNGERGCARLALTDADRDGRELVVGWMHELGMEVVVDRIGNVVGNLRGDAADGEAALMIGSHIATVRTGGRFDGNLGVLAGLEVVATLAEHGTRLRRPVAVAFFTDEEGARFQPDMLGSLVYVGGMSVEEALEIRAADDGAVLGDELERIGYAGSVPCPAASFPAAYLELHIEQGPVLEEQGRTIGVVTGVQGISWSEWTITGQSAHAGTTPMRLRHDPGFVAAAIAVEARRLATELGGAQVATVGRLELHPNLVNVVAAGVTMTVDLRNTDEGLLRDAETRLAADADALAAEEGVTVARRTLARFAPVAFDEGMVDLVERAAVERGCTTMRMPSGAGHDAQMLARVCPAGMIFVPSVNGLSHNIAEHTEPADVTAGANVLLDCVLALAR